MSQLNIVEYYDTYREKAMDKNQNIKAIANGVHGLMQEKVGLTATERAEDTVQSLIQQSIINEHKGHLAASKLFNGASKLHMPKKAVEQYATNFTDIDELISQDSSLAPKSVKWLSFTSLAVQKAWRNNLPLEINDENLRELLPFFESLVEDLIDENFDEDDLSHEEANEIISTSIRAMGPGLFSESKRKQMAQCSKLTSQLKIGLDVIRHFISKEVASHHQLIIDAGKNLDMDSEKLFIPPAERKSLVENLSRIEKKSCWRPLWYSFTDNYYKDLHQEQSVTDLYISLQAEDILTGSINEMGWSSCHGGSVGSSVFNLAVNKVTFVVYAKSENKPLVKSLSLPGSPVDNKIMRFYVHLYEDSRGRVWFATEHAYPVVGYTWAHKAILGLLHEMYPNLKKISTLSALVFGGTPEENLSIANRYSSGYYDYANDVHGALSYYNIDIYRKPYEFDDGIQYIGGLNLFEPEYDILLDQSFPSLSEGLSPEDIIRITNSETSGDENWIFLED